MKIGDKVRFLSTTGGGKIAGIFFRCSTKKMPAFSFFVIIFYIFAKNNFI